MTCHLCQQQAVGACRVCGLLYCPAHGSQWLFGPMCTACYDKGRAGNWFPVLMLGLVGITCVVGGVALMLKGNGAGAFLAVLSLPFLGLAAYLVHAIFRQFPGKP